MKLVEFPYYILFIIVISVIFKYGIRAFKNDKTLNEKERFFYLLAVVLLIISILISAFEENFSHLDLQGFQNINALVGICIALSAIARRTGTGIKKKVISAIFMVSSFLLYIFSFFYLFMEPKEWITNGSGAGLAMMSAALILIVDYMPTKETSKSLEDKF